jgi:hypothetical protein
VAAAQHFAAGRRGTVAFSVRTACGAWGRNQDTAVQSASVLKPMLLVADLRRPPLRDRPLARAERRLLGPMIRWSSNAAASRVLGRVGAARLRRDAGRWGMRRFNLGAPWGASTITAREQARFWLGIDHHVPARHRAYALSLLRRIVPSQRWGIARVAPRGWTLHFKGGWGSGRGRVDHQVALLTRGRARVALAILTTAQGDHAYGKRTLRGVALRLLRGLAAARRVC